MNQVVRFILKSNNPAFGGLHHLAKAVIPPKDAIGSWRIQIKKDTAATFRELTSDDIKNVYLVIQFNTA